MLKLEFPDLRNAPGGRRSVDSTNVTMDDLVSAFVELDKSITRFEDEADSRMGLLATRRCNDLVSLATQLRQRIHAIRKGITRLERGSPLEEDYLDPPDS